MTDDPKPVVAQKSNRTTVITIASISGIFVLFVAALWGAGFLTFSGSDPSSKVVAAALALLGGLVAAIVSIIGIVLKYSIDQRTETRLQIEATRAAADRKAESDRASALQTQAEQRLNLEAAIRAVELLGVKKGHDATIQRAGALLALSSLNQHSLTLELTSYLLEHNSLEPATACALIDAALRRGDEGVKRGAVLILYHNATRMLTETDTNAPSTITNWEDCLNTKYVRRIAVFALSRVLLARPFAIWQSRFENEMYTLVAAIGLAWQNESEPDLLSDSGAILDAILAEPSINGPFVLPTKTVDLDDIKSKVAGVVAVSNTAQGMTQRIRAWHTATETD